MRLAFLHGGLERGVDGVADYACTLARELTRRGHACTLVGLNDSVAQTTAGDYGAEGIALPVLRLPAALPWPERASRAREFLDEFKANWCSLQFVCYGFHPRGLVPGLAAHLAEAIGEVPLHVMLHELWIGEGANAPLKDRLVGAAQSFFIRRMLARLEPRVLHTSNPTYVKILGRRKLIAGCLPLFGTPPVETAGAEEWLLPELRAAGADIAPATRADWWLFGFFGALHPVWPPEPLLSRIEAAARAANRRVALVAIGGLGPGAALWERLARERAAQFTWLRLGRRSEAAISQFLNTIDFAIATSPLSLIGKSASAAAMLEHDVPAIVNREDGFGCGLDAEPLEGFHRFIRLDENFDSRLNELRARRPHSRLGDVTGQFLASLDGASRG